MYYYFLGRITTETNFDLILSFDDECFQIIIFYFWFQLSIYQCDSQVDSLQEL